MYTSQMSEKFKGYMSTRSNNLVEYFKLYSCKDFSKPSVAMECLPMLQKISLSLENLSRTYLCNHYFIDSPSSSGIRCTKCKVVVASISMEEAYVHVRDE